MSNDLNLKGKIKSILFRKNPALGKKRDRLIQLGSQNNDPQQPGTSTGEEAGHQSLEEKGLQQNQQENQQIQHQLPLEEYQCQGKCPFDSCLSSEEDISQNQVYERLSQQAVLLMQNGPVVSLDTGESNSSEADASKYATESRQVCACLEWDDLGECQDERFRAAYSRMKNRKIWEDIESRLRQTFQDGPQNSQEDQGRKNTTEGGALENNRVYKTLQEEDNLISNQSVNQEVVFPVSATQDVTSPESNLVQYNDSPVNIKVRKDLENQQIKEQKNILFLHQLKQKQNHNAMPGTHTMHCSDNDSCICSSNQCVYDHVTNEKDVSTQKQNPSGTFSIINNPENSSSSQIPFQLCSNVKQFENIPSVTLSEQDVTFASSAELANTLDNTHVRNDPKHKEPRTTQERKFSSYHNIFQEYDQDISFEVNSQTQIVLPNQADLSDMALSENGDEIRRGASKEKTVTFVFTNIDRINEIWNSEQSSTSDDTSTVDSKPVTCKLLSTPSPKAKLCMKSKPSNNRKYTVELKDGLNKTQHSPSVSKRPGVLENARIKLANVGHSFVSPGKSCFSPSFRKKAANKHGFAKSKTKTVSFEDSSPSVSDLQQHSECSSILTLAEYDDYDDNTSMEFFRKISLCENLENKSTRNQSKINSFSTASFDVCSEAGIDHDMTKTENDGTAVKFDKQILVFKNLGVEDYSCADNEGFTLTSTSNIQQNENVEITTDEYKDKTHCTNPEQSLLNNDTNMASVSHPDEKYHKSIDYDNDDGNDKVDSDGVKTIINGGERITAISSFVSIGDKGENTDVSSKAEDSESVERKDADQGNDERNILSIGLDDEMDINQLVNQMTDEKAELNKQLDNQRSNQLTVNRLLSSIRQLKKEVTMVTEMNQKSQDVITALQAEVDNQRTVLMANCDVKDSQLRASKLHRYESKCFRLFYKITTEKQAQRLLDTIKNKQKSLNFLEALVHRKKMILKHALPVKLVDGPPSRIPVSEKKKSSGAVNGILSKKDKKENALSSMQSVTLQILSCVADSGSNSISVGGNTDSSKTRSVLTLDHSNSTISSSNNQSNHATTSINHLTSVPSTPTDDVSMPSRLASMN